MESLTVQIEKTLNDYSEDLQDATNGAIQKIAKESVKKLKNTSPKKTGEYARGWKVKYKKDLGSIKTATVYNAIKPQLTQLLENGHVVRNKKGTFGRAPGIKHIKPVEEWANTELPKEIERQLP